MESIFSIKCESIDRDLREKFAKWKTCAIKTAHEAFSNERATSTKLKAAIAETAVQVARYKAARKKVKALKRVGEKCERAEAEAEEYAQVATKEAEDAQKAFLTAQAVCLSLTPRAHGTPTENSEESESAKLRRQRAQAEAKVTGFISLSDSDGEGEGAGTDAATVEEVSARIRDAEEKVKRLDEAKNAREVNRRQAIVHRAEQRVAREKALRAYQPKYNEAILIRKEKDATKLRERIAREAHAVCTASAKDTRYSLCRGTMRFSMIRSCLAHVEAHIAGELLLYDCMNDPRNICDAILANMRRDIDAIPAAERELVDMDIDIDAIDKNAEVSAPTAEELIASHAQPFVVNGAIENAPAGGVEVYAGAQNGAATSVSEMTQTKEKEETVAAAAATAAAAVATKPEEKQNIEKMVIEDEGDGKKKSRKRKKEVIATSGTDYVRGERVPQQEQEDEPPTKRAKKGGSSVGSLKSLMAKVNARVSAM
jgi:hypothetical protein